MDFSKEQLEKDVLYRILWDRSLAKEDYSIVYLDSGILKQVPFLEIKPEGDFFLLGDAQIPMHRIRRILCRGAVVWEKRRS